MVGEEEEGTTEEEEGGVGEHVIKEASVNEEVIKVPVLEAATTGASKKVAAVEN